MKVIRKAPKGCQNSEDIDIEALVKIPIKFPRVSPSRWHGPFRTSDPKNTVKIPDLRVVTSDSK